MTIGTSAAQIAAKWTEPSRVPELELEILRHMEHHVEQMRCAVLTKFAIDVEKLLCGLLGKEWQASGMSIETLVEELRAQRRGEDR
jgi:hypothetical protein